MASGFRHNIPELAARVRDTVARIMAARPAVLDAFGVQLLSWGFQDFQVKGRGGSAGGVSWAPLAASTIARKVRKAGGLRVSKRKRTAAGRKRPSLGSTQNGVDTGRLRSSLIYGKPARSNDQSIRKTKTTIEVGLGSGMEYGRYFDARRPIFGPGFVSAERERRLGDIAANIVEKIVKEKLER